MLKLVSLLSGKNWIDKERYDLGYLKTHYVLKPISKAPSLSWVFESLVADSRSGLLRKSNR
jgi:hypothetical protein